MTDINDWPENKAADPDCEYCLGDGLQADGETPCPCIIDRDHIATRPAHLGHAVPGQRYIWAFFMGSDEDW